MVSVRAVLVVAAFAIVGVVAAGYQEDDSAMPWVKDPAFAADDGYTTTSSGLRYQLLGEGSGKPVKKGDKIKVLYKLYLADDHKHIYSQDTAAGAFEYAAGSGMVIKGFDEAVLLMRRGDRGRFLMPSNIAYGPGGQAGFGIPGGATLEYFMEVYDESRAGEL